MRRTLLWMLLLLAACSASDEPVPSASVLPGLRLPGLKPNQPAGEYGWTGDLGSRGGMHRVITDPSSDRYRETQLVFAVEEDCFALGTDAEPMPMTVAGFEGQYAEPYASGPSVTFHDSDVTTTTGAYALAVGDRTLCVYLTWDPDTTQDELEAARQVVGSIRGHVIREDGIRINFTLPEGWDTG